LGSDEFTQGLGSTARRREKAGTMLHAPLPSLSAKMLYFQIMAFTGTLQIPDGLPLTRAHALALGRVGVGPTVADIHEFNGRSKPWLPGSDLPISIPRELGSSGPGIGMSWTRRLATRGVPTREGRGSKKWDEDHRRWRYCGDAMYHQPFGNGVYTPGAVQGLWVGRRVVRRFSSSRFVVSE
jgi:hypothetical protein